MAEDKALFLLKFGKKENLELLQKRKRLHEESEIFY